MSRIRFCLHLVLTRTHRTRAQAGDSHYCWLAHKLCDVLHPLSAGGSSASQNVKLNVWVVKKKTDCWCKRRCKHAGVKLFKASALQNAFAHLLGLKNTLHLKGNTPRGAFKPWVVICRRHACSTEKAGVHMLNKFTLFVKAANPLTQCVNDCGCSLALFLSILHCICASRLVANKGPVKLCLCLPGGCFAVPVHNCTGLPCQLSRAPWARHEASQRENKGHNQ